MVSMFMTTSVVEVKLHAPRCPRHSRDLWPLRRRADGL